MMLQLAAGKGKRRCKNLNCGVGLSGARENNRVNRATVKFFLKKSEKKIACRVLILWAAHYATESAQKLRIVRMRTIQIHQARRSSRILTTDAGIEFVDKNASSYGITPVQSSITSAFVEAAASRYGGFISTKRI